MSTVVVLGVGGLGCPAALAIAEEVRGVRLVLVDPDRVERSNLARQILFSDKDVGESKAAVVNGGLRLCRRQESVVEALGITSR